MKFEDLPALPLGCSRPFALLADVHASLEAIRAVGEWLDAHGVSEAVVLGDLVGYGASPQEVVDFAVERGWALLRGNHEDMLLDLSHVEGTRSLKSSARKALDWTRRRLDPASMRMFEKLPLAARIGEVAMGVHGSLVDPRHCYAYIYEFSLELNAARLREIAPPPGTLVCFGHTHQPVVFALREECTELPADPDGLELPGVGYYLVNPGSVGFPRDGDRRASFMVFDPDRRRLEHVRIGYDVEAAAGKIRSAGYAQELADRLLAAR